MDKQDEQEKKPDKVYLGASAPVYAFGESIVHGGVGIVGGGVAGAMIGSMSHDAKKHEVIHKYTKNVASDLADALKHGTSIRNVPKEIKEMGALGPMWHYSGATTKAFIGAVGVSALAGVGATAVGFVRGIRKARVARDQFNAINGENKELEAKIDGLESQLHQSNSFVERLQEGKGSAHKEGRS